VHPSCSKLRAMSRKKTRESAAPPWGLARFAVYVVVLLALGFGLSQLAGLLGFPTSVRFDDPLRSMPVAGGWVLAAVAAAALWTRLDGEPIQLVGFPFHEGMYLHLGLGLAVALALGLAAWALPDLAGAYHTRVADLETGALVRDGARVMLLVFALAAVEELIFRGALQRFLARRLSTAQAVLCSSLIFAIAHGVLNPAAPTLGLLGVAVAGGMLGLAYARSGTLWLPLGLHAGWNLAVGLVAGLPVSGAQLPLHLLDTEAVGNVLATGGAYGPEASLVGILVLAGGIAAVWFLPVERAPERPAPAVDPAP
jgi:membrane protease YdiL (CAAX protease family)